MVYRVTTKDGEVFDVSAKNMKEAAKQIEESGKPVAMVVKSKSCSGE